MEEEKSDISRLIGLKKYEQPEEGFFDDFLQDFQARQRQEMVTVSARSLLKERVITFIRERALWQWAAGGAAVCAGLVFGVVVSTQGESTHSSALATAEVREPEVIELPFVEVVTVVDPIEVKEDFQANGLASPLVATVGVQFDFIDLNQENPSENVEF